MRLLILWGTLSAVMLAYATLTCAQRTELSVGAAEGLASKEARQIGSACADSDSRAVDALPDAPRAQTQNKVYEPITGKERIKWILTTTFGFPDLAGGVITSAFGTAVNHPHEYGTHWDGFAKRYGIRLSGIATSNAMEAGLGAIWGEDPRYFREPERSFGARVGNTLRQTFEARRRDGEFAPAYARFVAITGSNFLSNTWRVDSEADTAHAILRTGEGFGGKLAGNVWREFWPSIRARSWHK